MYKAAVVGCGMIAGVYEDIESQTIYSHGKAYFKNSAIDWVAFIDIHPEKSQILAQKYNGVAFNDLVRLLTDFNPDCISVCVPDDFHFSTLKTILENSKSVKIICAEKPICSTKDELKILQDMERSTGIRIIVNHSRRFDRAHQSLKQLIQEDVLGKFIRGDVDYYGGWCHLGVHVVDILQYFFDSPLIPEKMVYAYPSKYPKDPTLHVEALLAGAPLRMTGFNESYYQILDINLKFEKGLIKIEDFGKDIKVFKKTINQEKENVLELDSQLSDKGMISPIVSTIETVVEYLKNLDGDRLFPFGLQQAEMTMDTLWKGATLYENQS